MHANHCCAFGSPRSFRYYAFGYRRMYTHTLMTGFILAGIPVYYMTQTHESARPRIISESRNCVLHVMVSDVITQHSVGRIC